MEKILLELIFILAIAWIFGEIFKSRGFPVLLGELLAGLIFGPSIFNLIKSSEPLKLISQFGIFFLMLYSGLEMDINDLKRNFRDSLAIHLGGFYLPFFLGFVIAMKMGFKLYTALFIGLAISISAIAIQIRILEELEIHKSKVGHVIIGATIIDGVVSLLIFPIIIGMVKEGEIEAANIAQLIIKIALFFILTTVLAEKILPHIEGYIRKREFTYSLIISFAFAALAEISGLHMILGAFFAGLYLKKFESIEEPFYYLSYGFLAPIFFVSLAFHVKFLPTSSFIFFFTAFTVIAMLGKTLGCYISAILLGKSKEEALVIGTGMNGRGAVEIIIVLIALEYHLINEEIFSALILMTFITTFLTPILLKMVIQKICKEGKIEICRLWKKTI